MSTLSLGNSICGIISRGSSSWRFASSNNKLFSFSTFTCENCNNFLFSQFRHGLFSKRVNRVQYRKMSTDQKLSFIPEPNGLPESKLILDKLLSINHREYNVVYQHYLANHIPHVLCSLYAMGATPDQIVSFNNFFAKRLEALPAKKFTIDENNWESYIADRTVYSEYLDFFDRELENNELLEVFKKYIPRLLPGLVAAALHPLIHIGYAIEFGSKAVLSEGLAYLCIAYNALGEMVDTLDKSNDKAMPSKSACEIIKQIDTWNPPDIYHEEGNFGSKITKAARIFAPQIKGLLNEWNFNPKNSDSEIIYKKTVDLTLAAVLEFTGSYRPNLSPSPDFFYTHGLTGNHAIRTLLPHLGTEDQLRLLQVGFLSLVVLYLTRSPVEFDESFVYKHKESSSGEFINTENLEWKDLLDLANNSTDDHLIKAVRSLHVIQETIADKPESKYPKILMIQGARLVAGTIEKESDWFETSH